MILIADSGSTKTDWCVLSTSDSVLSTFTTQGLNPYHQSPDLISATLGEVRARVEACRPYDSGDLRVFFYGSGVRPEQEAPMVALLRKSLPEAACVEAHSDMLGAARALCGRKKGIASILGTGANSCLYDGEQIVQNTPALGYIIGDEGSGAVLGKRFIHDLYGGRLSDELKADFETETGLSLPVIIDRVYRQPMANRFLGSFCEYIHNHVHMAAVHNLVVDMRSLAAMRALGVPVVFDATHSVQLPGGLGKASGGQRQYVPYLARAAAAVGIDALFLEVHPDPDHALSDGPNSLDFESASKTIEQVKAIYELTGQYL